MLFPAVEWHPQYYTAAVIANGTNMSTITVGNRGWTHLVVAAASPAGSRNFVSADSFRIRFQAQYFGSSAFHNIATQYGDGTAYLDTTEFGSAGLMTATPVIAGTRKDPDTGVSLRGEVRPVQIWPYRAVRGKIVVAGGAGNMRNHMSITIGFLRIPVAAF